MSIFTLTNRRTGRPAGQARRGHDETTYHARWIESLQPCDVCLFDPKLAGQARRVGADGKLPPFIKHRRASIIKQHITWPDGANVPKTTSQTIGQCCAMCWKNVCAVARTSVPQPGPEKNGKDYDMDAWRNYDMLVMIRAGEVFEAMRALLAPSDPPSSEPGTSSQHDGD